MDSQETKQCPYCSEDILVTAVKCKHCGEWLNVNTPLAKKKKPQNMKVVKAVKTMSIIGLVGYFILFLYFLSGYISPPPSDHFLEPVYDPIYGTVRKYLLFAILYAIPYAVTGLFFSGTHRVMSIIGIILNAILWMVVIGSNNRMNDLVFLTIIFTWLYGISYAIIGLTLSLKTMRRKKHLINDR